MISTAALREIVPSAWLDQLRPGGRLVSPWGTDWSNGVMLSLDLAHNGVASGRFSGDLAFMRLRGQRRALYGWQPAAKSSTGSAFKARTESNGSG